MLDFLTSKVLMWICGVLLVALIVTGAFAGCAHQNANTARAQRDQWETVASTALEANATNVDTIGVLKKANDQWRALFPSLLQLKASQAAALHAIYEANKRRDADYARAKERDRGIEDCDALLHTDFEHLCPTVARSLRRAAGGD